jgi:hypothetical protein
VTPTFNLNESVSVHADGRRQLGTVVQILASRLLVIRLEDGRTVRRHSS